MNGRDVTGSPRLEVRPSGNRRKPLGNRRKGVGNPSESLRESFGKKPEVNLLWPSHPPSETPREIFGNRREPLENLGNHSGSLSETPGNLRKSSGNGRKVVGNPSEIFGNPLETPREETTRKSEVRDT